MKKNKRDLLAFLRMAAASLLGLCAVLAHAQALPAPDADDGKTFRAIAMHDVRHNVRESFVAEPEPTALDERTVADFFSWLRSAGYHPVSLQQIVDARAGGKPLPARAVLLSFDDGYESFYSKVYPLLKQFNYPAVMALVTGWLEVPPGQIVAGYGAQTPLRREAFITWEQAREMAASGLVEYASHGDAIHTGVPGNPQGNLQPAAVTHRYDSSTGRYEDDAAWIARVEADLRRSRGLIEQRTGARVRAMVWPYGAYNKAALRAADRAGMPITLTLDEGPNTPDVPLQTIRRGLATYDIAVPEYALLRTPARPDPRVLQRAMHIDLDNVYDPDPQQQEANLSRLLDRVQAVGPSAVFLQAFADPDGDGAADALYFPNRHLPMRADLFNRVAWQLRTRTGVEVYAWMPVLAFQLPANNPLAGVRVTHMEPASAAARDQVRYHRLSPADARVRALIGDIYEDLAKNAPVAGLLFHDDATYSDDEDASPAALAQLAAQGLPADLRTLRGDPALRARWTEFKTRQLTDFTLELAQRCPRMATGHPDRAQPLRASGARARVAGVVRAEPLAVAAGLRLHRGDGDAVHGAGRRPEGLARGAVPAGGRAAARDRAHGVRAAGARLAQRKDDRQGHARRPVDPAAPAGRAPCRDLPRRLPRRPAAAGDGARHPLGARQPARRQGRQPRNPAGPGACQAVRAAA